APPIGRHAHGFPPSGGPGSGGTRSDRTWLEFIGCTDRLLGRGVPMYRSVPHQLRDAVVAERVLWIHSATPTIGRIFCCRSTVNLSDQLPPTCVALSTTGWNRHRNYG